jgi:probable F420-dependent oxidoreductase
MTAGSGHPAGARKVSVVCSHSSLATSATSERLGYEEVWLGETNGYDAFVLALAVAQATAHVRITIGPVAVGVRDPMMIAMATASVAKLGHRQIDVAIGASSDTVVRDWHGRTWRRTAQQLAESAQVLRRLLAGEKVTFDGETYAVRGPRVHLPPPGGTISVAAFGDRAIDVAARHADRMVTTFVTPDLAARLRSKLHAAALGAGRTAPPMAAWVNAAVDPTPDAFAVLKRGLVGYVGAPGYRDMVRRAGFDDVVDYALTRPHPRDLLAAIPDELVSAIALVGDEATVRERLEEYFAVGVEEVCLHPTTVGDPGGERTLTALRQY